MSECVRDTDNALGNETTRCPFFSAVSFYPVKEDHFNANSVMFSKLLMYFLVEGR